jgi:hypothetical protein
MKRPTTHIPETEDSQEYPGPDLYKDTPVAPEARQALTPAEEQMWLQRVEWEDEDRRIMQRAERARRKKKRQLERAYEMAEYERKHPCLYEPANDEWLRQLRNDHLKQYYGPNFQPQHIHSIQEQQISKLDPALELENDSKTMEEISNLIQ